MSRLVRSKWLLAALLAFPLMVVPAVVAFLVRAPAELRAVTERPVGMKKLVRTVPERAFTEEVSEEADRRRQAYAEEARQQALERYNTWQGTQLYGRGADDPVARAFNSDPPAPAGRIKEFAAYLGETPTYKVVGWRAALVSATPNDQGWQATVRVNPTLASLRGGVPFTPYETFETWQIGKDGTATALDVRPGDKPRFLMVD